MQPWLSTFHEFIELSFLPGHVKVFSLYMNGIQTLSRALQKNIGELTNTWPGYAKQNMCWDHKPLGRVNILLKNENKP